MCSHLDALQAMAPVNFRRVPRDSHSVPKQASFYVALGTDVQGGPNGLLNSVFEAFFRRYFSLRLSIQFWWIFGGSEPEK